ncbi:hypothetical protein K501DRAFT_338234 [Backusella circina FSU 941]|nr:hypothetical protein K501DRAFT_338234 [Backusella circina FSU 941]
MDTNWCTYCDCAVSPLRNSIYCSEVCYRRDAMIYNPVLANYQKQIALQQQQQLNLAKLKGSQIHSNTNTTLQSDVYSNTRRDSSSSISSDGLAAMYFESMAESSSSPSSGKHTTPVTPCLSTSSDSVQSHTPGIDECYTSLFSFKEEIYEKIYEDKQLHPVQTIDYSQLRI